MATNEKIKLDITSAFDPGGFTRADKAVKGLGQTMNRQGAAVNKVVTAFGDANTSVGKFAKSAQNLMGAFAGGGIWGLAAAGVALVATKFMEAREAAKKFAAEQEAALKKAWSENLIKRTENSLSILKSKHAQIADEIERGAKAAEKIAKAYEGLVKSEISVSSAESDRVVALLEGQQQSALVGVEDPVKRKAIELDYERQIFDAKRDSAKFERDQKLWMAGQNVNDAEAALAAEKSKLDSLKARAEELETWMSTRTGESKTRLYGQAKVELDSTRGQIKDSESTLRQKNIDVSSARNDQVAASAANQAAMTREAIAQGEMADKQNAFDKTLADYQVALDKRVKVEEQITRQEEKIERLKEKEKDREDKKTQWNQQSTQAKQLGAAGWNQQQTAAADAKEQTDKGTTREGKWVANARKRMSTGAKLAKDEMARIANFEDWNKLQGANPFDPGKAAKDQIKRLDDNLNELKGLRTDLQNALKVN